MAETEKRESSVWGILLAAGTSSRFGEANKLLAEIDDVALVRRVAESMAASRLANIVAVRGFQGARVATALTGLDLEIADNPEFETGMASSIARGIARVGSEAPGAMIVLGDMPGVGAQLIDRLLDAFEHAQGERITFPVDASGRQGNPVIWPRAFFADLQALSGDRGAKALIGANRGATLGVSVEDEAAFRDIDEPSDLSRLKSDGDK